MTDDRLILWGVEGVLVADEASMAAAVGDACTRLVGKQCPAPRTVIDLTDDDALRECFRASGYDGARLHELVAAAGPVLAEAMRARRDDIVTAGRTPGSAEALAQLRHRQQAPQSLFTGRIEPNAALAVGAVGLDRYLDLEVGGYALDLADRGALYGLVRERVRAKYGDVPAEAVLVTACVPDAAAAVGAGVQVVGVAADPARAAELRGAGAATVLPDLARTTVVLDALYG